MTEPRSPTSSILVCGSRDWPNPVRIERELWELRDPGREQTLILGGARGADRMAAEVGHQLGYRLRVFHPAWDREGKRAGFLRNLRMLDEKPDLVLAFHRDGSRGTQHTIDQARRRGIPVRMFAMDEARCWCGQCADDD